MSSTQTHKQDKKASKNPLQADQIEENKKYDEQKTADTDWKSKPDADKISHPSAANPSPKTFIERKELAVSTAVNLGFPQHIVEAVIARDEGNIDVLSQLK